jgi:hypothetical protein
MAGRFFSPPKTTLKVWELSGGIINCASCGKRLFSQRLRKSSGDGYHHYYRCRTRGRYGPESCSLRGMRSADELEASVWRFVTHMLKDPEQLRADLERVVEQERRGMHGDPEREAKAWLDKLAEAEGKRSGFPDMAAEGLITPDELRTKLAGLEETRRTAERELGAFRDHREALEALGRDNEAVLETYARMAPEALNSLTPEERHQFYRMLRLWVVQPDGRSELSGVFTDGQSVCTIETTSPCCGHRTHSSGATIAATSVGPRTDEPRSGYLGPAVRERRRPTRIDGTREFLEGSSEMTSGNIQLGPNPDQILEAIKGLLRDDPEARQRPAEEVSKELVRDGYLQEEPDPVLVAEMLEGLEAEEQSLQADEVSEEGNHT